MSAKKQDRTQQQEERRPIDDPRYLRRVAQLDIAYDQLFKVLPTWRTTPVEVRELGKLAKRQVTVEIDEVCPTCATRLTFKINGVIKATMRFKAVQDLWVAQTNIDWWCDYPWFFSVEQICAQFMTYLKKPSRNMQHGMRGTQTLPLFEMERAS